MLLLFLLVVAAVVVASTTGRDCIGGGCCCCCGRWFDGIGSSGGLRVRDDRALKGLELLLLYELSGLEGTGLLW